LKASNSAVTKTVGRKQGSVESIQKRSDVRRSVSEMNNNTKMIRRRKFLKRGHKHHGGIATVSKDMIDARLTVVRCRGICEKPTSSTPREQHRKTVEDTAPDETTW